jgi:rRNA-processing protein FCF1
MFSGPFAGIERLLIDGNNLLHRVSGGVDQGALRGLLARLQNALPPAVEAIVMLDGHAAPGTARQQKVAANLEIRHAGSLSADDALLNLVRDRPAWTTLVSDDRALRDKARNLGASTQRLAWLEALLARGGGSSGIGRRR